MRDVKDDLIDVSVFDDLTLQGRLFQTGGAAKEKALTKRVRAHGGRKREDGEWQYQKDSTAVGLVRELPGD